MAATASAGPITSSQSLITAVPRDSLIVHDATPDGPPPPPSLPRPPPSLLLPLLPQPVAVAVTAIAIATNNPALLMFDLRRRADYAGAGEVESAAELSTPMGVANFNRENGTATLR